MADIPIEQLVMHRPARTHALGQPNQVVPHQGGSHRIALALQRPLLLVLNHKPNSQLDPLRREFIRFVLSKQGQEVVIKDGYLPVTADQARKALQKLSLKADF